MLRAAHRSSLGAPNIFFVASGFYIQVVTGRCPGWLATAVPTQPGQRPVTTWIYKPEAADTVWIS